MVYFCPTCCNLLLAENETNGLRFFCRTCPYIFNVSKRITKKVELERKQVDDVLGGEESWENVDQTEAVCEKCGNNRAYFFQMQTRSADEPMTIFFKCTNQNCNKTWKEQ